MIDDLYTIFEFDCKYDDRNTFCFVKLVFLFFYFLNVFASIVNFSFSHNIVTRW